MCVKNSRTFFYVVYNRDPYVITPKIFTTNKEEAKYPEKENLISSLLIEVDLFITGNVLSCM